MAYKMKYRILDREIVYSAEPNGDTVLEEMTDKRSTEPLGYRILTGLKEDPISSNVLPPDNIAPNHYNLTFDMTDQGFFPNGLDENKNYYALEVQPQKPRPGVFVWQCNLFVEHFARQLLTTEEKELLEALPTKHPLPDLIGRYKPSLTFLTEWTLTADFSGEKAVFTISESGDIPKKIFKKDLDQYFKCIPSYSLHQELRSCVNSQSTSKTECQLTLFFKKVSKCMGYIELLEDGFTSNLDIYSKHFSSVRHEPYKCFGIEKELYDCIVVNKLQGDLGFIRELKNITIQIIDDAMKYFPQNIPFSTYDIIGYKVVLQVINMYCVDNSCSHMDVILYAKRCQARGLRRNEFTERMRTLLNLSLKLPNACLKDLMQLENAAFDSISDYIHCVDDCADTSALGSIGLLYPGKKIDNYTLYSFFTMEELILDSLKRGYSPKMAQLFQIIPVRRDGYNVGTILRDPATGFVQAFGEVPDLHAFEF